LLGKLHRGAIETVKKMIIVVSTLFLLFSTLTFTGSVVVKGETNEAGFTIKMNVTYYNNGTENWNFTEEDRAIGLFMNNTWQTVQLINHSHPLENITIDEDGNPIAVLQFPESELKPGENISYTITYYALSKPRILPNIKEEDSETLDDIPEELKEDYCGEGDTWLVTDRELQDLAYNITNGETKVLTIVKNFITWIRDPENVVYKTHETPLYPNETYTEGEGDCDDQAILLITLCRIYGIPAYLQVGCIYIPTYFDDSEHWNGTVRNVLKRVGWHGWAMVYVPPWHWLPVDLTYILSGNSDPLNSIKKAAVTSQETLQYMNISQMDYVASARRDMNFLVNNNFYVYTQDEMTRALPENLLDGILEKLFPWILATTIVVVAVIIAGIFICIRRKKRLKETEFKLNSS
jgi:hypothetical protein